LSYASEAVRCRLENWAEAHGIDVVRQLIDVLVDRFESPTATVVEARAEADTLSLTLSAPAWAHQRELVVLPTGGVAW
jgi:hypothetical protein